MKIGYSYDIQIVNENPNNFCGIYAIVNAVTKQAYHMLTACTQQQTIPSILKSFKGTSARRLFLKHPSLKNALWGGHLWNPSYFAATVNDQLDEQIKHYINHHQINWK